MKKLLGFLFLFLLIPLTNVQANTFVEVDRKVPVWNGEVLSGEIHSENYIYRFVVEEAATYTFTMKDPENGYTKVILYDEQGNIFHGVDSSEYDGDDEKSVVAVQLKKGTYYAEIRGAWFGGAVPYEVRYTISPLTSFDIEPNFKKDLANQIPIGKTVYGTLSGVGLETDDYYTFTLNEFSKVTLDVSSLKDIGKNRQTVVIQITNENGGQVLDALVNSTKADSGKEYLQAGTYSVRVINQSYSVLEVPYAFKLTHEPADETITEVGVWDNFLENNKRVNGFIYNNSKTRDEFYFELDEPSTISVLVESSATNMAIIFSRWDEKYDEYLQYYPEGSVGGWSPTLTATVPAGKYEVSLGTRYTFDEEAPYTIRLQRQRFTDVPSHYLYYEQIESLSSQGIITGYKDGSFKPKNTILRQHVFAMLSRIESLELNKIREIKPFTDLNDQHPYYKEIKAFYEAGIIDGSGTSMHADRNLTRAQLTKILVNTFNLQMTGQEKTFKDVKQSDSFYSYIQILASHGITTGSNGNFMPNQPVTREHFSVFLQRTLKAI